MGKLKLCSRLQEHDDSRYAAISFYKSRNVPVVKNIL